MQPLPPEEILPCREGAIPRARYFGRFMVCYLLPRGSRGQIKKIIYLAVHCYLKKYYCDVRGLSHVRGTSGVLWCVTTQVKPRLSQEDIKKVKNIVIFIFHVAFCQSSFGKYLFRIPECASEAANFTLQGRRGRRYNLKPRSGT